MQHEAYNGLTRRRSIAFVDEVFFIVVDEVRGPATGRLTLRNGLGGGILEETARGNFVYRDGDAGLRMLVFGPAGADISVDKDWFSEAFHEKSERPVVRVDATRSPEDGTQCFVTIICPFSGSTPPPIAVKSIYKGIVSLSVSGKDYKIDY